jgi:hypothetical protein
MAREKAYGMHTVLLTAGQSRTLVFRMVDGRLYSVSVRYGNDAGDRGSENGKNRCTQQGEGTLERIRITLDGRRVGEFRAVNTRPPGGVAGDGWNEFCSSPRLRVKQLREVKGVDHTIRIEILEGDEFGVEIDSVALWRV